jgi:CheY-like chemotaxis protein
MIARKITCLLIDDDVDDQEIFMLALTQIGDQFNCLAVNNGYEALQQLKKQSILPDYIFLDLNMPRMNGKECLKELKKNDRLTNIPVIIYSTSSSLNDINDTRRLGAADFITKPFSIKDLIDALCGFFVKQGESIQVGVCK